jgi:hypothetical protein
MTTLTVNKEKTVGLPKLSLVVGSGEAMVVCPECKAIQSVWIQDGRLMPTRKFRQVDDRIFHDCGARQPCRIYRDW